MFPTLEDAEGFAGRAGKEVVDPWCAVVGDIDEETDETTVDVNADGLNKDEFKYLVKLFNSYNGIKMVDMKTIQELKDSRTSFGLNSEFEKQESKKTAGWPEGWTKDSFVSFHR